MENTQKNVGIITMHRVINYGSTLQAYALQKVIDNLGFNSFLIDYVFPNSYHKKKKRIGLKNIKRLPLKLYLRLSGKNRKQKKLYNEFWNRHYKLTDKYNNRNELFSSPPLFDIYVTGSDQVWNPKHMKGDTAFFCDFINNNNQRISYAASFSCNKLDPNYKDLYKDMLNKYSFIGVRENNGVKIVENLINSNAICVCDPTMLLTQKDYSKLSIHSFIKINKPYILAYILSYNFNPYPTVQNVIDKLSQDSNLPVIYLSCHNHKIKFKNSTYIYDAGPTEFLWLFQHASFIVTSSFHGTIFSLLFEKQFFAVTDNKSNDGRIDSLMKEVGAESNLIRKGDNFINYNITGLNYSIINKKIENYRKRSMDFLIKALS